MRILLGARLYRSQYRNLGFPCHGEQDKHQATMVAVEGSRSYGSFRHRSHANGVRSISSSYVCFLVLSSEPHGIRALVLRSDTLLLGVLVKRAGRTSFCRLYNANFSCV